MQFSAATILTALVASAAAQKVHPVKVSNADKAIVFSPNKIVADVGDMVQFQFLAGNHSVVQSNFDNPCEPIALHNSSVKGMFSGYMDVAASAASGESPVYTMMISAKTPLWLYCSQGMHCQGGMTMVINENTAANATRSLENYSTAAKGVAKNLDPISAGVASGSESGSGSGSETPSGTPSSDPASTSTPAIALGASVTVSGWAGLLSVVVGLLFL